MSHHKRGKPKHQRAGCLYCKPHKDERVKGAKESKAPQERRADLNENEPAHGDGGEG